MLKYSFKTDDNVHIIHLGVHLGGICIELRDEENHIILFRLNEFFLLQCITL